MDQSSKLLNCIAQTAQMGCVSIDRVLTKSCDPAFRDALIRQRQVYQSFQQDAETRLNAMRVPPQPKSALDRAGAWIGLEMSTIQDKSSPHLADLMIQGATMGVVETTKARNECSEASPDAVNIANTFIAHQQDVIEQMKPFLC